MQIKKAILIENVEFLNKEEENVLSLFCLIRVIYCSYVSPCLMDNSNLHNFLIENIRVLVDFKEMLFVVMILIKD